MRTTMDIPDETYRELKIKAAQEGTPVRQIVLRGIQRELEGTAGKPVRKLQLRFSRLKLKVSNHVSKSFLFCYYPKT